VRRRYWLLLIAGFLAIGSPANAQRGRTYCNITDIETKQLSNGVQVIISADGQLDWWIDLDQLEAEGAGYWHEFWWGWDLYPNERFTHLPISIWNARSKLGASLIPIGAYPISHAAISIPDWAEEGVGLQIDMVNYLGMVDPEGQWRFDYWVDRSEDRSQIYVNWSSDRFPPAPQPVTPEDLPAELSVRQRGNRVSVRAINAKLHDVLSKISSTTGHPIAIQCNGDIRVSAYLEHVAPGEAVRLIATGSGLCAEVCPDGEWVVAETHAAAGGYAASASQVVYLEHLKASRALDLLPNFLLDYLRADEEANAIIVNAPAWMLGRIADDLATLDQPPSEVVLEAVTVEYASTDSLWRELNLVRSLDGFAGSFGALTGDIEIAWLDELLPGWDVALSAHERRSTTSLQSRARVRAANGQTARLFAGQEQFIIIERVDEGLTADIQPVETGSSLDLRPRVGSADEVILDVTVRVRNLVRRGRQGELPTIGTREVDNVVRVRDGETILIAGLNDESRMSERRSIPVLSALPLVGNLFESPARSVSERQLAIFVTPHIVRNEIGDKGESDYG